MIFFNYSEQDTGAKIVKKIIAATSDGDPHMPAGRNSLSGTPILSRPMFQFVVVAFLSFGPALIFSNLGRVCGLGLPMGARRTSHFSGMHLFPMAFLGVAMFDTLSAALKPAFVVGSILRVPREYSLAAAVFVGIIGIRWLSELLLGVLMKIPLVPALLSDVIMIYLLMIEARILGLLYLSKRRTLGWFKRDRAASEN